VQAFHSARALLGGLAVGLFAFGLWGAHLADVHPSWSETRVWVESALVGVAVAVAAGLVVAPYKQRNDARDKVGSLRNEVKELNRDAADLHGVVTEIASRVVAERIESQPPGPTPIDVRAEVEAAFAEREEAGRARAAARAEAAQRGRRAAKEAKEAAAEAKAKVDGAVQQRIDALASGVDVKLIGQLAMQHASLAWLLEKRTPNHLTADEAHAFMDRWIARCESELPDGAADLAAELHDPMARYMDTDHLAAEMRRAVPAIYGKADGWAKLVYRLSKSAQAQARARAADSP
jgi:hypothetical protein